MIIFVFTLFLWPKDVFSANHPELLSPSDNSVVETPPKLSWGYSGECYQKGSCFKVEVDNNPDFSSPEKSTYTDNLFYSPKDLTIGSWSWRVKAKDSTEKWSDWSNVFEFSISGEKTVSPTPSPTANQQSPQPSNSTQKNQTTFQVKNIPEEVNSSQEFEAQIALMLPNNPNQIFYLKGAFKKEGESNYFGQTYASGWVKNSEKYSKQLKISTDSSGSWEGKIRIMPDDSDSGFTGSGEYIFKVGRYSDTGSGPNWTNEITLKIIRVANPSPSDRSLSDEEKPKEQEEEKDISASVTGEEKTYEVKIASVAGINTISNNTPQQPETKVLGQRNINWLLVTLGLGILISGSGFVVYKFKKEKENAKNFN